MPSSLILAFRRSAHPHAETFAMGEIGYDSWVTIEMLAGPDDPLAKVVAAARSVKALYWP